MTPDELRLALPGVTLAAQSWGEPSAPPLLALHGWLDNAASWAPLAPLLATRHRVIALELPGHGRSGHLPPGQLYHLVDYVRAVLAAADALSLQRFELIGHSLGAGIASLVAAAAPQRITRLHLIEGLGPLGDDGSETLSRWRAALQPTPDARPLRVFPSIEVAVELRRRVSGPGAELARLLVERGLRPVDGGWSWSSDPRLTRTSPLRMAEAQIHALLGGIEAPTSLLLASAQSPHLRDALLRQRAACISRLRTLRLEGGHHLHMEQPGAVARWLLEGADALAASPPVPIGAMARPT